MRFVAGGLGAVAEGYAVFSAWVKGIFFRLGGYCMAMFLQAGVLGTGVHFDSKPRPAFRISMDWNQITELPNDVDAIHSLFSDYCWLILTVCRRW